MPHDTSSSARSLGAFRFPYDKYEDEFALYENFRYLQEFLQRLGLGDKYATTVIVAASDSHNRSSAHFKCDGVNDEVEWLEALDALPASGGEVVFLDGTYNIDDDLAFTGVSSKAIRLVSKGAKLRIDSGITMSIQAQNILFDGFDVVVAGTANATITLTQPAGGERGNVVVVNNHFHDTTVANSIVRSSAFSGITFMGNTATDITGSGSHTFIFGSVGTGTQTMISVIGNHFENCNTTYMSRAAGSGAAGVFGFNTIKASTYTSLTLASDNMFAAHNVDGGTHLTGEHNLALDDLSDVTESTPADNEVLAYDSSSAEWINQTAAEAGLATDDHTHELDELDATGIADGQILGADGANGAEWIDPPQGAAFSELMLIGA